MDQKVQNTLAALHRGQQVTVIYDDKFDHQRFRITGKIVTVDHFWKTLQVNNVCFDFSEICEIHSR